MPNFRPPSFLLGLSILGASLICAVTGNAQEDAKPQPRAIPSGFSEQDFLRGSITPERAWWDLKHYDLRIEVFPETKSLKGSNLISFRSVKAGKRMQIDLQPPLKITRVVHDGKALKFERNGNVYLLQFAAPVPAGVDDRIEIFYEGVPTESVRPPWSGGFTWKKDKLGKPFIATTCQGIGASIWWPNKDHGADEPDRGMDIRVTVPEALSAVSNGRLLETQHNEDLKTRTFHWQVLNPINNYGVNVNIANYVTIKAEYEGEFGKLDLEYWVLEQQREKAIAHFKEVPRTLAAFEHWFGKYPFYEDSFKLVVVPYLGMEHQSSVTYGNGFKNGYRQMDLSRTGVGLKFDFIIIHESAHEWFGNNISMKDAADMWIHESFANYAENLFVEYHFTEKEAQDYVIGCRRMIRNDGPIIGTYEVNKEGSGDMYYKGGNMLHTMRHVLGDDKKWREVLRAVNRKFWHKTVTTQEFEAYMSEQAGFDFSLFFDQYLRTAKIPVLKYAGGDKEVSLWWDNVVPGFAVPVVLRINGQEQRVVVSETPKKISLKAAFKSLVLDRNFYMTTEKK